MPDTKNILVINCGSSSIRFELFSAVMVPKSLLDGSIERINSPAACLSWHDPINEKSGSQLIAGKPVTPFLLQWLCTQLDFSRLVAVGHRVVHGMQNHETQLATPGLIRQLRAIIPYDPDHLPQEIGMIDFFTETYPDLPQWICFDTDFHWNMPGIAKLLPLPGQYRKMGLQRYGFHGLSYQYLLEELIRVSGKTKGTGKVILAHLGSGASMVAVKDGKCLDTTMGFTANSGMVMGTRTGDLEPGILSFFLQQEKMDPAQFNTMINRDSGLLGVSGITADMQVLLGMEAHDGHAAEAVELFCYQAKKWMGALTLVLGGLDTIVFSGGIGENAPAVRARICKGFEFMGLELDEHKNKEHNSIISTVNSSITVRVIRTKEALMIAQSVLRNLNHLQ